MRIAIDLKRGVDPDKLMAKLYRSTTLQDSFSCNFNVLVDGYPRVMGVRQILHEWVKWRIESTRRRINFDLGKKSERLHLLHGLEAILLDIDKAIAIIRGTKLEAEVVPNLMKVSTSTRPRPSLLPSSSSATSTRSTSSTAPRHRQA